MSETTEKPRLGTRMTVPLPGPVTFAIPVWTTWTAEESLLPRPGTVTNWSNSPTSSAVAS